MSEEGYNIMLNKKLFFAPALFISLIFSVNGLKAQEKETVLTPETSNEAMLNRLQPPAQVMDAIGVEPGMVVAEIGAGRGRYVVQLAMRVGETGKVYAEDIDSAALDHLAKRCSRWNLENVETILGDVKAQMIQAGYKFDRIDTFLKENDMYIYVFRKD